MSLHDTDEKEGENPMTDWIEAGEKAPDFTLRSDSDEPIHLRSLEGRPVVLYFYPRDNTSGCTREACAFRDRKPEIDARGAVLLGVSPDDVDSHRAFRDKYDLNFTLLADPTHKVAERYGAWREKNMYGKKSLGVQRSTFLIDGDGIVRKVWKRVRVDGHDDQVMTALDELLAD